MAVVLSWVSKPARSVPDNFAIASRAALPLSDWSFIRAMVSYQIPTSALARLGLSFNVSVLMTRRPSIPPGILLESYTSVAPGLAFRSRRWGFQVTPAVVSGDFAAGTISAFEVLTVLISFSCSFTVDRPG